LKFTEVNVSETQITSDEGRDYGYAGEQFPSTPEKTYQVLEVSGKDQVRCGGRGGRTSEEQGRRGKARTREGNSGARLLKTERGKVKLG